MPAAPNQPINFGAINVQPQGQAFNPTPATRPTAVGTPNLLQSPQGQPSGLLMPNTQSRIVAGVQKMQQAGYDDATIQNVVNAAKVKFASSPMPETPQLTTSGINLAPLNIMKGQTQAQSAIGQMIQSAQNFLPAPTMQNVIKGVVNPLGTLAAGGANQQPIQPTFPIDDSGGAGTVLPNVARSFGNIPSDIGSQVQGLQQMGKAVGQYPSDTVKDLAPLGAKGALSAVGQGFVDTFQNKLPNLAKGFASGVDNTVANSKDAAINAGIAGSKFLLEHPTFAPGLAVGGEGAGARDLISDVASPVTEAGSLIKSKVGNLTPIDSLRGFADAKAKAAIVDEVQNLLKSTKSIGSKTQQASRAGTDLQKTLSDPQVFKGLKVENGKINPDEAIVVTQDRIGALMDAKSSILPKVDEVSSPQPRSEIRAKAVDFINNSTASNGDKADAIARMDKQLNAYPEQMKASEIDKLRADMRGSARDAKGQLKSDSEYAALEHAARDTVFDITDHLPVQNASEYKALNDYIKKMIRTQEFLDKTLRGQVVKGGRLGSNTGKLIGAIAGSGHGPIGTLVTSRIGGVVADIATNNALGSSFKMSLIRTLTDDPAILAQAEKLAGDIKGVKVPELPPGNPQNAHPVVNNGNPIIAGPEARGSSEYVGPETRAGSYQSQLGNTLESSQDPVTTQKMIPKSQSILEGGDHIPQTSPSNLDATQTMNPNTSKPTNSPSKIIPESVAPEKPTVKQSNQSGIINPGKMVSDIKSALGSKQVSKELEPLAKEAQKYSSAEEFVNSRKIVYHGTTDTAASSIESGGFKPGKVDSIWGGSETGVSFTTDKATAQEMADHRAQQTGGKPVVIQADITDVKNPDVTKYGSGDEIYVPKDEIGAIKTKSQLTDFYNKVKGETPKSKIGQNSQRGMIRLPSFLTGKGGNPRLIAAQEHRASIAARINKTTDVTVRKQLMNALGKQDDLIRRLKNNKKP